MATQPQNGLLAFSSLFVSVSTSPKKDTFTNATPSIFAHFLGLRKTRRCIFSLHLDHQAACGGSEDKAENLEALKEYLQARSELANARGERAWIDSLSPVKLVAHPGFYFFVCVTAFFWREETAPVGPIYRNCLSFGMFKGEGRPDPQDRHGLVPYHLKKQSHLAFELFY